VNHKPSLALLRIRDRVESGGHNVPERDVRRRFGRTLRNLFTLYRPLLDTLHFFDNATETPRLIWACVLMEDGSTWHSDGHITPPPTPTDEEAARRMHEIMWSDDPNIWKRLW
jgi:hypothetical protein